MNKILFPMSVIPLLVTSASQASTFSISMNFDEVNEMAHTMGFGSLWELNGVHELGSGQYTGQHGLAAYQAEFNQSSATSIPVETEGKEGDVDYHRAELLNGAAKTGITNSDGLDMSNELMTAWLNAPIYVSNTTIQSFRDIGYTVATVPIGGSIWLFMSALVPVFLRKWKVLSGFGIRT
ncbi:MAG: hypothetical protein ABL925_07835 [Methylococcales bacterium]